MKGHGFYRRLHYALNGLRAAARHEVSFRTELLFAVLALLATLGLQPPLIWMALVAVMIALVLAAELFNTALEHLLDGLHPGSAPFVKLAKDCAAAAVLVLSVAAVAVFGLMLVAIAR